jgi:hypothetical protein
MTVSRSLTRLGSPALLLWTVRVWWTVRSGATLSTAAGRRPTGTATHFPLVRAGITSGTVGAHFAERLLLLGRQNLHEPALHFLLQPVELVLLIFREIEGVANMRRKHFPRFKRPTARSRRCRTIWRATRPAARRPKAPLSWTTVARRLTGCRHRQHGTGRQGECGRAELLHRFSPLVQGNTRRYIDCPASIGTKPDSSVPRKLSVSARQPAGLLRSTAPKPCPTQQQAC